jgi:hypothetical protein
MKPEDITKQLYLMHQGEMPWLPDWEKIPSEVRECLTHEIVRVSRIALKVIVGG